jgi:hypothetical protein
MEETAITGLLTLLGVLVGHWLTLYVGRRK